ncbi:MAG: antitoxin, partial [Thermoanaerobaculia bacterium]
MREDPFVLERNIRDDLEVIDRLFAELADVDLGPATPEEQLIVAGYRMHNLYNAFENIFRNIARAFENSLEERSGWHAEL